MSVAVVSSQRGYDRAGQSAPATIWHKSAPAAVRKAYQNGRESAGWKAWQRHLRLRKRPLRPGSFLAGGQPALVWGLEQFADPASLLPQFDFTEGSAAAEALDRWLRDSAGGEFKLEYALSALWWSRCLPELAAVLPPTSWWALIDQLLHLVVEAGATCIGGEPSESDPLIQQLLAGELALTLACLFPELAACRALLAEARWSLSAGLIELLDGQGLPHAEHLDQIRPLLACWTRCRVLGRRWNRGCWTAKAEKQYGRLVLSALRLARRDGARVFSDAASGCSDAELLAAAADLTPRLGLAVRTRGGGRGMNLEVLRAKAPKPAMHSEWAATAVMRPDWSRSAPRLAVLYPGASCRMELSCGKDVLWSGPWGLEITVDGTPATPTSDWSELCWLSDSDVDYLELELELSEGLRVQRHLVLAREDRFLLLADAVLSPRPSAIGYRGTLPLCPGVAFRQACETREGTLVGRKRRALVLPLALPEWLADRGHGELTQTAAGLELRQSAEGRALFAPLFLALDRSRMTEPATWRQLTVAESWATQPRDAAVGYRVAIGRRQWLLYRSLTAPRNRSLLGHNLSTETLVACFGREGQVEPLIEIE